ncbi:MAG: DegT/DnrJ/EryC1/StrS family aminotransferase [Lentisphaerae bacterium]|nr:DegT/DnrJ/EryC1/StrS family aminotransferase [Lentisphaerota bacterium]
MEVPLLDLKAQHAAIGEEVERSVAEVFASQIFILGPKVDACEKAVAEYSGAAHGIGMSSGTDALLACLMIEEIGPGDEVITSPYTFFATAGSIARVGATPVFADIDPVSYNIRPDLLEAKITERTRAIMPVHLYGQMADMTAINAIAARHGLIVIEDACQAIGARDGGMRAGSCGTMGCFSFFPSKNLGGAGDGGMVVTNDAARADKLRWFRNHGANPKYYHRYVGGNFRLDAVQAAVVSAKLPHLDAWTDARRRNAARYDRLFAAAGLPESADFALPQAVTERHIFNQYVIRAASRDALRAFLAERRVGSEVYYPVPLHLQECFVYLGCRRGDYPESESAAASTLALPVYPELSDSQAEYAVSCIAEFFKRKRG